MTSESRNDGTIAEVRNPDGTFAKGNPGRPKGARLKVTRAVVDLLQGQAEAITQKAVAMALQGDTTALRFCLERIAPARKDAPVEFDLPAMTCARDAAQAAFAILSEVAYGGISPLEGATVMGLVEQYRKTLETSELEARLTKLETAKT